MDELTQAFVPPSRIDLARETDFQVGALSIRPSRCEVEAGGVRRSLQRRVMQVLVALARSTNQVVSQHELILRCWGGLSVSDDAIGRCIGQLRRLAVTWPEPPFEIETIAGVGYRLEALPVGAAPIHLSPTRARRTLVTRPRTMAAAVAVLLVTAGVWAGVERLDRPPALATPVVEVRPFSVIGDDPALKPFAARAADQIAGFLGDSDVRIVAGASPSTQAPLAFHGAVSSSGGELRLRFFLEEPKSATTIWSRDYAEPAARSDALIGEAQGGAMEAVNITRSFYGRSGLLLDPETMLLAIRGGEELISPSSFMGDDDLRLFEQALDRRPDSAVLRAGYAAALVQVSVGAPPAERAQMLARAQAEDERIIREQPDQAGDARYNLAQIAEARTPRDLVGEEARLDGLLKAAPDNPFAYGDKCGFLVLVGRAAESLYFCRRALSLRPHTALFLTRYAQAIDLWDGHPEQADPLLEEAARLYPNYMGQRIYRWGREAFAGSPDKALLLTHDPNTSPPLTAAEIAAVDRLERARKSGARADADAALAFMRQADERYPIDDFRFLFPMALGRMDEAFPAQDTVQMEMPERELLMFRFTDRLRRDRRWWPIAARAGLVRYWLTTNKWPDFCSDPTYPIECRAEAKRVVALGPVARD